MFVVSVIILSSTLLIVNIKLNWNYTEKMEKTHWWYDNLFKCVLLDWDKIFVEVINFGVCILLFSKVNLIWLSSDVKITHSNLKNDTHNNKWNDCLVNSFKWEIDW